MSITPLKTTGEDIVISTPLLYTLTDSPVFRKSPKTTGANISKPTSPLHEVFIQQHVWPNVSKGRIGFGWDIMEPTRPNKVIFRVLDNTTVFHCLTDLDAIEWVTPTSKIVDISRIVDWDVIIT